MLDRQGAIIFGAIIFGYKIIFGYCDINCHHYFDVIGTTRTRSKHEYKIRPKVARTNDSKYSFFS